MFRAALLNFPPVTFVSMVPCPTRPRKCGIRAPSIGSTHLLSPVRASVSVLRLNGVLGMLPLMLSVLNWDYKRGCDHPY